MTRRDKVEIPYSDAAWGTCRWCGDVILRPDGTQNLRRRWHATCQKDYSFLAHSGVARGWLAGTERGVCQGCGFEGGRLNGELRRQGWNYGYRAWTPCAKELKRIGFNPMQSLWDMDHVVPLRDGGGRGKEWLWTLCQLCHKKKTSRENSLRAQAEDYIQSMLGFDPGDPEAAKTYWRQYLAGRRDDGTPHQA